MNQEPTPDGLAEIAAPGRRRRDCGPWHMKSIIPQRPGLNVTVLAAGAASRLARRVAADRRQGAAAAGWRAPVPAEPTALRASLRSRSELHGALHRALGSPGRGAAQSRAGCLHLRRGRGRPRPLGGGRAGGPRPGAGAAAPARLVPGRDALVEIPHWQCRRGGCSDGRRVVTVRTAATGPGCAWRVEDSGERVAVERLPPLFRRRRIGAREGSIRWSWRRAGPIVTTDSGPRWRRSCRPRGSRSWGPSDT